MATSPSTPNLFNPYNFRPNERGRQASRFAVNNALAKQGNYTNNKDIRKKPLITILPNNNYYVANVSHLQTPCQPIYHIYLNEQGRWAMCYAVNRKTERNAELEKTKVTRRVIYNEKKILPHVCPAYRIFTRT